MPTCFNLHKSGLRRSVRIKELEEKKRQNADGISTKNNGAHVAFCTVTRPVVGKIPAGPELKTSEKP
eukprot:scaffold153203_cov19-Cyclotella_meneghiniana.AAC.1